MADPSDFVNWSDYFGMNQDNAEGETQKLLGDVNTQEQQLRQQAVGLRQDAEGRGYSGQAGVYDPSAQQSYQNSLASYGDAVERLRDPATLRVALERSYGSGHQVSALDAAMLQQKAGNRLGSDLENQRAHTVNDLQLVDDKAQEQYRTGQQRKEALTAEQQKYDSVHARQRALDEQHAAALRLRQRRGEVASAYDHRNLFSHGEYDTKAADFERELGAYKDKYGSTEGLGSYGRKTDPRATGMHVNWFGDEETGDWGSQQQYQKTSGQQYPTKVDPNAGFDDYWKNKGY